MADGAEGGENCESMQERNAGFEGDTEVVRQGNELLQQHSFPDVLGVGAHGVLAPGLKVLLVEFPVVLHSV